MRRLLDILAAFIASMNRLAIMPLRGTFDPVSGERQMRFIRSGPEPDPGYRRCGIGPLP